MPIRKAWIPAGSSPTHWCCTPPQWIHTNGVGDARTDTGPSGLARGFNENSTPAMIICFPSGAASVQSANRATLTDSFPRTTRSPWLVNCHSGSTTRIATVVLPSSRRRRLLRYSRRATHCSPRPSARCICRAPRSLLARRTRTLDSSAGDLDLQPVVRAGLVRTSPRIRRPSTFMIPRSLKRPSRRERRTNKAGGRACRGFRSYENGQHCYVCGFAERGFSPHFYDTAASSLNVRDHYPKAVSRVRGGRHSSVGRSNNQAICNKIEGDDYKVGGPAADKLYTGQHRRAVVLVVLGSLTLGLSGLVIRSIEEASPWQIVFYRGLALAAGMMIVLLLQSHGRLWSVIREVDRWMFLAGLLQAVATTAFVFALVHTTVANTLFLLSASPFVTALLAWAFLHEAVRPFTWITMLIVLSGVAIMVGSGIALGGTLGNMAALLGTLGFSCFVVTLRRGRDANMLPALIVGGCLAAAIAATATRFDLAISTQDMLLAVLWGGVLQCTAHFLFIRGSRHLAGSEFTLLVMIEVVTGPLWVWIAFDEVPSMWTLIGGSVVLVAVTGHCLAGLLRVRS